MNAPMVAMGISPCEDRARAHRGLDRDRGRKAAAAAAGGPQRSGGWRAAAFLLGDAKPSGGGKKLQAAIAAEADEAQPAFRQIRPIEAAEGVGAAHAEGFLWRSAPSRWCALYTDARRPRVAQVEQRRRCWRQNPGIHLPLRTIE